MLPKDRLAYSPIADRPPLKLPNGARMAVWVIINVEEWDATRPMPRTVITPPAGGAPMPDVPNWAWHEYGNRVGFWRFVEIFDAFAIPGVLAINGSALNAYPQIVRAAVERNWEFMGHGFTQRNLQKVADERADIRKVREVIAKATGKDLAFVRHRAAALHEANPMLGHRGCRLGITYPEIYEMQVRAIFQAAVAVAGETGETIKPEIMIPLVALKKELDILKLMVDDVAAAKIADGPRVAGANLVPRRHVEVHVVRELRHGEKEVGVTATLLPARSSATLATTRSCRNWGAAAWASSTAPARSASTAPSRSR